MCPGLIRITWLPRWPARNNGQSSHLCGNLNLSDLDVQGHAISRACLKAPRYSFADIVERFSFRASLRNAAWNCRALGYKHPGFIGLQRHKQLHTWILLHLDPDDGIAKLAGALVVGGECVGTDAGRDALAIASGSVQKGSAVVSVLLPDPFGPATTISTGDSACEIFSSNETSKRGRPGCCSM